MILRSFAAVFLATIFSCSSSKKMNQSGDPIVTNLKKHIGYLADDKLEGRRAGTEGEKLAMEYIAEEFAAIGLDPKGTDGYYQPFPIVEGKKIDARTSLSIDGTSFAIEKDYFPFAFSGNGSIDAIGSPAIQEKNAPWFYDLKKAFDENRDNPHFAISDFIYSHAKKAAESGAIAVIFYNSQTTPDNIKYNGKDRTEALALPVIYLKQNAAAAFKDPTESITVALTTSLSLKQRTGHNVIGYIDNNASNTVVIGAHFDHLGYGEDGNSRNTEPAGSIHNGADDNASGTAGLIELAAQLRKAKNQNNNYLLIAFSAEELGLFGSKYFVENPTIELPTVNYMINMDMIGRLSDSTLSLTIGGFATSPQWSEAITVQKFLIPSPETAAAAQWLNIKIDSSGTGPSDHTSFYSKKIPVLFYFTGLHTDYHKPTDDAEKINYAGEKMIIRHIYELILSINDKGKLVFTPTRETQTSSATRFTVSLGIMPDYAFAGFGLRADGVTKDRVADKAGMASGDIIIGLGGLVIKDIESYMQVLSRFKKGDKTTLKYKHGDKIIEKEIRF